MKLDLIASGPSFWVVFFTDGVIKIWRGSTVMLPRRTLHSSHAWPTTLMPSQCRLVFRLFFLARCKRRRNEDKKKKKVLVSHWLLGMYSTRLPLRSGSSPYKDRRAWQSIIVVSLQKACCCWALFLIALDRNSQYYTVVYMFLYDTAADQLGLYAPFKGYTKRSF